MRLPFTPGTGVSVSPSLIRCQLPANERYSTQDVYILAIDVLRLTRGAGACGAHSVST